MPKFGASNAVPEDIGMMKSRPADEASHPLGAATSHVAPACAVLRPGEFHRVTADPAEIIAYDKAIH